MIYYLESGLSRWNMERSLDRKGSWKKNKRMGLMKGKRNKIFSATSRKKKLQRHLKTRGNMIKKKNSVVNMLRTIMLIHKIAFLSLLRFLNNFFLITSTETAFGWVGFELPLVLLTMFVFWLSVEWTWLVWAPSSLLVPSRSLIFALNSRRITLRCLKALRFCIEFFFFMRWLFLCKW